MPLSDDANTPKLLYPLAIAGLLLALLFGFAVLPRVFHATGGASIGSEAPPFTLPVVANALDGKASVSLHELRGHPVLIDFWATWCRPCQAELPVVNRIAERFRDRGLVVVGINTSDEAGKAEAWAKTSGLTFPIAYDASETAARGYGVDSLPTLVLVSKTGKIVAVRGLSDDAELERLVRAEL